MKPEKILQSDMLDIVFENKNKDYGAYQLRKYYNHRLIKSIGVTTILVVIFAVSQSWKVPHKSTKVFASNPEVKLVDFILEKKTPEEKKVAITQRKNIKSANNFKPIIVPEKDADNKMSEVDKLDKAAFGKEEKTGTEGLVGEAPGPKDVDGTGKDIIPVEAPIVEEEIVESTLNVAEVMPEFPGGRDALIKFMQRNLSQPDTDGEKIVVMAKFVVNANGDIVDVDILKSGRKDLDSEVMRVIKKMPKWKAGSQNGHKVSVYYKLPVTFLPQE